MVAALVVMTWLVAVGGAAGAPTWGGVQTLSPDITYEAWVTFSQDYGTRPAVGISATGRATAVWAVTTGEEAYPRFLTTRIETADRPSGGTWSAAQTVETVDYSSLAPVLGVNQRGDAVAAWQRGGGGVSVMRRAAGGAWGAPVNSSFTGRRPKAVIDDNGQIHVAYLETDGLREATSAPGGPWVITVMPGEQPPYLDSVDQFDLAVDPSGPAVLAWVANDVVNVAQWRSSTGWRVTRTYAEPGARDPQVTARGGRILVAWHAGTMMENRSIRGAVGTSSGAWNAAEMLFTEPYNDYGVPRPVPQVALAADGSATVMWLGTEDGGMTYRVRATSRLRSSDPWGAVQVLDRSTDRGAMHMPDLGVDSAGTVTAVWGINYDVRTARRSRTGPWTPASVLAQGSVQGESTFAPVVAVAGDGRAVAAYERSTWGPWQEDHVLWFRYEAASFEDRNTPPGEPTDAQLWATDAGGAARRITAAPYVWPGTALRGRATFADAEGGPLTVEAQWRTAGGAYADANVVRTTVSGPGTRDFALPSLPAGSYVVRFRAVDAQGAAGPWHFLLDGDPDWTVVAGAPAITRVLPSAVTRGAGDTTLYVDGDGLTPGSVVQVDGVSLPTQVLTGTRLQATLPASMLAGAGTVQVRVLTDVVGATTAQRTSAPVALEVRSDAVAPENVLPPEVTGTASAGGTLTCGLGTWTGAPDSFAIAWLRDGAVVATGAAAERGVDAADAGHSLACRVTARNAAGAVEATSAAVAIPVPQPQGGTAGTAGTPGPAVTPAPTTTTLRRPARVTLTTGAAVVRRGAAVTLRLRFDRPARRLMVQVQDLRGGGFVPVRTLRVSGGTPRIVVRLRNRGTHLLRVVWTGDSGVRRSAVVRVRVR